MRKSIALLGTLIAASLLAPTPSADAGAANSLTVTGKVSFWDDDACRPGSGTSCDGTATPVELWAPWAPACGVDTCPTPDIFDWVFESTEDIAGQHACLGYVAPTTIETRLASNPDCSFFAAGVMTSAGFGLGPWCGYGAGDFVGDPAEARIAAQTWQFAFTLGVAVHHTGPTFVYQLRDWDTFEVVGTMKIAVVGADGTCGLAPDFEPATSYDAVAELTWTDG